METLSQLKNIQKWKLLIDKRFPYRKHTGMKLGAYLKREGLTPAEFGRMVGLKSRASIIRYLSGDRIPAPSIMNKIKAVTKGAVTADSFH